ncbi:MAG: helix-turn-helix domain containing protein, partial [Rhodospirillaceae bacterium]|nr:helix-turn-helix domain containing protein [Rhodospirillaceae bacterium]
MTGRREWNKQQKRDRIVTAARALFYAQGYKKTTTQQIARAAKVASGTLFLYAKTKEDLLLLVFYDEFMAIINAISVSADDPRPVEQQVLALFNTLFDYHARDIEL